MTAYTVSGIEVDLDPDTEDLVAAPPPPEPPMSDRAQRLTALWQSARAKRWWCDGCGWDGATCSVPRPMSCPAVLANWLVQAE